MKFNYSAIGRTKNGTPVLNTGAGSVFGTDDNSTDNSLDVIISEDGTTNVRIHRALLGSALMLNGTGVVTAGTLDANSGLAGTGGVHALDPDDPAAVVILTPPPSPKHWKISQPFEPPTVGRFSCF